MCLRVIAWGLLWDGHGPGSLAELSAIVDGLRMSFTLFLLFSTGQMLVIPNLAETQCHNVAHETRMFALQHEMSVVFDCKEVESD